jgi:hypothetical protein
MVDEKDYYPGIPIALKVQYPSLDKLGGITDFDRGEMTQKAIDSLARFYLDGVDMSIHNPLIMDPEQVVLSSIVRQPKAKWFVKDGHIDAIKPAEVNPQGLSTFQSTYQILKSNLLSLGAQTDTAVAQSVDPGFGRTPEALKMQSARMGARDAWDTFMMEQFIERTYTIMANMIAKKGISEIAFKILGKSIKKIQEEYPNEDYATLLGPEFLNNGSVKIDPKVLEGEYRYVIDEGSTLMKTDDTGEKMMGLIKTYFQYPQIATDFANSNKRLDAGEAFKRMVIDQGVQDADKIIVDTKNNAEAVNGVGSDGATGQPVAPGTPPAQPGPDMGQIVQAIQQLFAMVQKLQNQPKAVKSPTETINYKDVPEDVKRELEAAAGLTPSKIGSQPTMAPSNIPTPINNQPIIQ